MIHRAGLIAVAHVGVAVDIACALARRTGALHSIGSAEARWLSLIVVKIQTQKPRSKLNLPKSIRTYLYYGSNVGPDLPSPETSTAPIESHVNESGDTECGRHGSRGYLPDSLIQFNRRQNTKSKL